MPNYTITRQVPYSADQVFVIASDVANYKQFLPLVRKSVVTGKTQLPDGREAFNAELTIAYKKLGIHEVLQSNAIVDRANRLVTATSEQGPVKRLKAEWLMVEKDPKSCEINFSVDYELKSKTLQFVLSGMFDMMVRKVMNAFEERARELYGSASASA